MLYSEMGFSVIPCRKDKKPYVAWTPYQTKYANQDQIRGWWKKWPDANPAIVTGGIHDEMGVDVVDADSEAGKKALEEFLPDSLLIPTVKTPKGYHFYFKHSPGLHNGTRVITDCDLRTTGGYVLAPPGYNEAGQYKWIDGLKITDIDPAAMPEMLFDVLKNGGNSSEPSKASTNINDRVFTYKNSTSREDITFQKNRDITPITKHNKPNISFLKGSRDNDLFHVGDCLRKGGMDSDNILKVLDILGCNCKPPFPKKEIIAKHESILKRADSAERGLTAEVRHFINITSHNFSITNAYQNITNITPSDRAKITAILHRMAKKEGIIEPVEGRAGYYRKVESDCQPIDWVNAETEFVDIWLPYELDRIAGVQPGNVLVFAGEKDSGKSAALMNIAKENRHKFNVHYFSSEMGDAEFKLRANKFDITPDQWGIKVYERSSNFQDVIKPSEGNLNLIDFLEIYDNFYKIGADIANIHSKLKGAIAVIAIQKSPGQDFGRGGAFSLEKARLYISLFQGRAKCISCKNFREDSPVGNPRGKEYHFKLVDGCKIIRSEGWHAPAPVK